MTVPACMCHKWLRHHQRHLLFVIGCFFFFLGSSGFLDYKLEAQDKIETDDFFSVRIYHGRLSSHNGCLNKYDKNDPLFFSTEFVFLRTINKWFIIIYEQWQRPCWIVVHVWSNCCIFLPASRPALTFQRARMSRANSNSPPSVLPRIIQVGIL